MFWSRHPKVAFPLRVNCINFTSQHMWHLLCSQTLLCSLYIVSILHWSLFPEHMISLPLGNSWFHPFIIKYITELVSLRTMSMDSGLFPWISDRNYFTTSRSITNFVTHVKYITDCTIVNCPVKCAGGWHQKLTRYVVKLNQEKVMTSLLIGIQRWCIDLWTQNKNSSNSSRIVKRHSLWCLFRPCQHCVCVDPI